MESKVYVIGDTSLKTWRLKEIELRIARRAYMRGEIEMLCLGDPVPPDFLEELVKGKRRGEYENHKTDLQ